MSRYNVHFEVNKDIEVSVMVETPTRDAEMAVKLAREKLVQSNLGWASYLPYVADLLE